MLPDQIVPWVPRGLMVLGTDGFGCSDTRQALRRFFEIDAALFWITAPNNGSPWLASASAFTVYGVVPVWLKLFFIPPKPSEAMTCCG
jgi:hypothetical protein